MSIRRRGQLTRQERTAHPEHRPSSGTPIEGAVALVTGGHRGFARALVNELLERGAAKVYATSRSSQPQREPRIVPLVLDVADDASVGAAAQAAPDVSIVVNNAGILLATSVLRGGGQVRRAALDLAGEASAARRTS
jgi:NAD(P)-dependent dehydrogenase (short-subunit alcohol dehydrogenase family)